MSSAKSKRQLLASDVSLLKDRVFDITDNDFTITDEPIENDKINEKNSRMPSISSSKSIW